jgi:cyclopropane fatty-acyl-phospholipid synthase-like methyltransferase
MQTWEKIFAAEGEVFLKPHKDMGKVVRIFKKHCVKKVLDLGCGSGRHLVYLAKHGFEVYGLDAAKSGMKIAKAWLKKENLKAHLKVGDFYQNYPYKDSFFDAVVSINAIHHGREKDVKRTIAEIYRIVKPGGVIFITVSKRNYRCSLQPTARIKTKKITSHVYVPCSGPEKGIPHFMFNKQLIKQYFHNFIIQDLYADENNYGFFGVKMK